MASHMFPTFLCPRSHRMKRDPSKVHNICGLLRGGRTKRPRQVSSQRYSFLARGDLHGDGSKPWYLVNPKS